LVADTTQVRSQRPTTTSASRGCGAGPLHGPAAASQVEDLLVPEQPEIVDQSSHTTNLP